MRLRAEDAEHREAALEARASQAVAQAREESAHATDVFLQQRVAQAVTATVKECQATTVSARHAFT